MRADRPPTSTAAPYRQDKTRAYGREDSVTDKGTSPLTTSCGLARPRFPLSFNNNDAVSGRCCLLRSPIEIVHTRTKGYGILPSDPWCGCIRCESVYHHSSAVDPQLRRTQTQALLLSRLLRAISVLVGPKILRIGQLNTTHTLQRTPSAKRSRPRRLLTQSSLPTAS